jgi:hypothetical protein
MNQNENERHPYVSITRGMKSSFGVHSMYDHVFSRIVVIVAYVVIVNVHYTIFMQIKSIIMTSIEVWKSFFMIRISICCWVQQRKMWETSLWICSLLSKTIVTIISQCLKKKSKPLVESSRIKQSCKCF